MHHVVKKGFLCAAGLLVCQTGLSQSPTLPDTHPKYRTTREIMKQVAVTFAETRELPRLIMYEGVRSNRIARFSNVPGPHIELDERLYDLCTRIGEDSLKALAVVLGHELSHYYLRHEEWAGFARLSEAAGKDEKKISQLKSIENQADLRGLRHAFSAGYDGFGLLPRLYGAVYREYKLESAMKNYDSLEERSGLASREEKNMRRYAGVSEIAKFFFLMGDYPEAVQCFGHVANHYPLREFYVNIGTGYLKQALATIPEADMPFALPVELENGNRLRSSRGDQLAAERADYLRQADRYFSLARDMDLSNLPVRVNLAITHLLKKQPGTAIEMLAEARQEAGWSDHAQLVQAIAALYDGRYQQAEKAFASLKEGNFLDYNRLIFKTYGKGISRGEKPDAGAVRQAFRPFVSETASLNDPTDPSLGALTHPGAARDTLVLPVVSRVLKAFIRPAPNAVIYRIESNRGTPVYEWVVPQQTGVPYPGDPVASSDTPLTLRSRLGEPAATVPYGPDSRYLIYPKQGLILQVSGGELVGHQLYRRFAVPTRPSTGGNR